MGELPFSAVVRAGLVLIVFAAIAAWTFPTRVGPLPGGMHTPGLAFELVRSPLEVETMFDGPQAPERAAWVRAFDRGNTVDFAVLVAYGAMLSLFARALRQRTGSRFLHLSLWGAFIAPLDDALENTRMLAITDLLGGDYTRELVTLRWFTWIKWTALALCLLGFAPSLFARGRWARMVSILCVLSFSLTLPALLVRGLFAEAMLYAVTLSFVGIFVQAVMEHREP